MLLWLEILFPSFAKIACLRLVLADQYAADLFSQVKNLFNQDM